MYICGCRLCYIAMDVAESPAAKYAAGERGSGCCDSKGMETWSFKEAE